MVRFVSAVLLVASLAFASTSALTDDAQLAAEIKELKSELSKLEFVQAIEKSLRQETLVATELSTSKISVTAFASSSEGSGSSASTISAGTSSGSDDFAIEELKTSAPVATTATTDAPAASSDSGSSTPSAVVSTPAPAPSSGASTLAPSAVTLAAAVVYAML